jgi:hypothetical protein
LEHLAPPIQQLANEEYSSAVTAPFLPTTIAAPIVSMDSDLESGDEAVDRRGVGYPRRAWDVIDGGVYSVIRAGGGGWYRSFVSEGSDGHGSSASSFSSSSGYSDIPLLESQSPTLVSEHEWDVPSDPEGKSSSVFVPSLSREASFEGEEGEQGEWEEGRWGSTSNSSTGAPTYEDAVEALLQEAGEGVGRCADAVAGMAGSA